MKTRFNTFDIVCVVGELQRYIGMRVNNIYDIDNRTYLIKLQKSEEKVMILLESGIRIHSTAFEWPKNIAPSGFSMKMRKHLKNKRLESLKQLGTDRIIDLQFGTGEAAYHLIIELYDKGNIILTDHELKILYILRPHTEGDKVKFGIRELYPQNRARQSSQILEEELIGILEKAKTGDQLKKVLLSQLEYGPAVLEHVLLRNGFSNNTKIGKSFSIEDDISALKKAIYDAENIFKEANNWKCKGYIIQNKERSIARENNEEKDFLSNQEFHPLLFKQHEALPHKKFDYFNDAVDVFFSSLESQKIELKGLQQEKEVMKKLDNVKKDHKQRLVTLENTQKLDKQKAELITRNQEIVEKAIMAIQSALASQLSWADIEDLVKESSTKGDPVAKRIKNLKLESNHISLYLSDPYASEDWSKSSDDGDDENSDKILPMTIDIDLALSAFANATRYYDKKRHAAKKKQKTLESQNKAFKSAEKKTKQTLKEVQTLTNIYKARKVLWFEKFFWFISSENFLVFAGRDQQQNEIIVKRYLKSTDIYVHADIHGASSVIIKNPFGQSVPPKTLNEAGTMAICYSVAWEAKVVTNAYWVWGEQVSKTAPTGEYLTTGSFMVRGKKNFLPQSHLIMGLGFLFKLEDGCVDKHKGERKVVIGTDLDDFCVGANEHCKDDEVELEIPHKSDEKHQKSDTLQIHEGCDEKKHGDILKENIHSTSYEGEEENMKFPDTQLNIQHTTGSKINILMESIIPNTENEEGENVFFLGDNKPVILQSSQRHKKSSESINKRNAKDNTTNRETTTKQQQMKRGQKSKLKKIKEKYKDQDDEERQMRMEILQSSGLSKEAKKEKKSKESNKSYTRSEPKTLAFSSMQVRKGVDDEGSDEEVVVQADIDVIDTLTGIPTSEDDLVFAVPVIAPYNVLSNYKFKVKLTPGIGKKGKAAKTAVAMFMKDRSITQREKDLLKAIKDDQLARNFPGKVKLSAPRLQIVKK